MGVKKTARQTARKDVKRGENGEKYIFGKVSEYAEKQGENGDFALAGDARDRNRTSLDSTRNFEGCERAGAPDGARNPDLRWLTEVWDRIPANVQQAVLTLVRSAIEPATSLPTDPDHM